MAKSKKKTVVEQKTTDPKTAPRIASKKVLAPGDIRSCSNAELETHLLKVAEQKHSQLEHCEEEHGEKCPCSSGGKSGSGMVDLIVLIDTSGSMSRIANAVDAAARDAIEKSKEKCETDLKVTYLGVDGTFSTTVFNKSHRKYITDIHGTGVVLAADTGHVGLKSEQGANAIQDLSKYAEWREGACRAIFYISDEELDSISPRGDLANEAAVTLSAINEANLNNVTVFAHHVTQQHPKPPAPLGAWANVIQNYKDLCESTGGKAYFSDTANADQYVELLQEVICNACGSGCTKLELPNVSPCFSVVWGDSDCDCMETNDFEVLLIKACNCYSNLAFQNLTIGRLIVLDSAGKPVATLPDGNPSVEVLPSGPICFGNLEPCTDNTPTCKAREFIIRTRGALSGKYQLKFEAICFDVVNKFSTEQCFTLDLCKD
ncbi:MAG: hypothetical protein R2788_22040 [Saprospiraceae bacterium]